MLLTQADHKCKHEIKVQSTIDSEKAKEFHLETSQFLKLRYIKLFLAPTYILKKEYKAVNSESRDNNVASTKTKLFIQTKSNDI